MTVTYQSNFDALADGVISDFIDPNGSPFSVATGATGYLPTSGAKVYKASSVGDSCVYTPPGATSNQAIRFTQKIGALAAGDNQNSVGAILRSTTTTQVAYRLFILSNAGNTSLIARIAKYTSGQTTLATSGDLFTASTSDVIHLEASATGTTTTVLELRVWKNSDARPASPTVTYTDTSTPHQTGYAGVRKHGTFANTGCDDLVITDAAGGEDYFYPVLTQVENDLACSYAITGSINSDLAASYSIESTGGSVDSDLAVAYAITGRINSDLAGTYSVAESLGTIVTNLWENNTGTSWEEELAHYSWFPGGRIGSFAGITPTEGSANLVNGVLTVNYLPKGAGILIGSVRQASVALDTAFLQPLTAA